MFPGGGFYGIKEIFLEYAGLPKYLPFPVAVQHGWLRVAHTFESASNPPEIWVWSDRIAKELEAHYPKERIRVVGSFFCYLLKLMPLELMESGKAGSICMPPHSSHFLSSTYQLEEFADSLAALPDDYKPITVMLYYLDMDEPVVNVYASRGFEVVTNGTLFSTDFLYKFVNNIKGKKYSIFGVLGSNVFFSGICGLKLHWIDTPIAIGNLGNAHVTQEMLDSGRQFDLDLLSSLNDDCVQSELGCAHVYSRKELRHLILRNYFTLAFLWPAARRLIGSILVLLRVRKKPAVLR